MALANFKFLPGIDKQDTPVGAENRWVDSDNTRFRYQLPEKVGGWSSLLTDTMVGVARKQHAFTDLDGNRYVAIGTDKFLLIYFEGTLYDITPWRSNNAGAQTTFTSSTLSTDSTVLKTCTITTTSAHSLSVGDIIVLDSVTLPGGTGLTDAQFEDKLFQVLTVPTDVTFTIDSSAQASSAVGAGGSMTVQPYQRVGPAAQTYGYGYGVGNYGGTITGIVANDLDGSLAADADGNNGSATQIRLTDGSAFPTSGTIAVENELITYSGRSTNELTGIARAQKGTSTAIHADATVVDNATNYTGWGNAVAASTITLEPGLWSLSNWGGVLVATIANGKTFTWNSGIAARFTTRASTLTTSYVTAISGAPFTFGFEQVGTNCGLIGQNAAVEVDGVAYWVSNNGFFMFDGTVKTLTASVEDYVYNDFDTTKGQQVYAGINNLFTEVIWYYPTSGSTYNDRYVVFNYGESNPQRGLVWYTGTEARTTWIDAIVYPKPFATKFNSSSTGTFPSIVGETGLGQSVLFEHETGTDQVNPDATITAITSYITSYDFDLDHQGDGEFFLALRRVLPNFKTLTGTATFTLAVKRYPSDTQTSSPNSPFSVTSTTQKFDTRARGRFANVKIANTAAGEDWRFGTLRIDLQPDGRR
jgi:hypothetical protein